MIEVLHFRRVLIDPSIPLTSYLSHFVSSLNLLRRKEIAISSSCIIKRHVIFKVGGYFTILQSLSDLPGTVKQIEKDHTVNVAISQEDCSRVQISVNEFLLVEKFYQ